MAIKNGPDEDLEGRIDVRRVRERRLRRASLLIGEPARRLTPLSTHGPVGSNVIRMQHDTRLTTTKVDETIVEPALRGVRKFGASLGSVALGGAMLIGVVGATFGGILMALTTGIFFGLGAVFLSAGVTATSFGALGIFGIRKADRRADARQLERRLLKLVHADGSISDALAARRTGSNVEEIRQLANRLVREGVLTVDVDPQTGADIYRLEEDPRLQDTSLSVAEAEEMRGFDARLAAGSEHEEAEEASLPVVVSVEEQA